MVRKVIREDFRGADGIGKAEFERCFGIRSDIAQFNEIGRLMGKSDNVALFGSSRAIGQWADAQDTFSFESCSSSLACDTERVKVLVLTENERRGLGDAS